MGARHHIRLDAAPPRRDSLTMAFPRRKWTEPELVILRQHTDPRLASRALYAAGFWRCASSCEKRMRVDAKKKVAA